MLIHTLRLRGLNLFGFLKSSFGEIYSFISIMNFLDGLTCIYYVLQCKNVWKCKLEQRLYNNKTQN
jgi:hypothetical protein